MKFNGPRHKGIGGTNAAAILEKYQGELLNPYDSPHDTWLLKTRRIPSDFTDNRFTLWGKLKEPTIARHFAKQHGVKLACSPRRKHKDYNWFYGSPDRLIVGEDVGLEIKTGQGKQSRKWGRSGTEVLSFEKAKGVIPLYYWTQIQWYMELMGYERWIICVLLDSADYREFPVHRDQEFLDYAVPYCGDWWAKYVVGKTEPPIDWGRLNNKWLTLKHGSHGDTVRRGTVMDDYITKGLEDSSTLLADISKDVDRVKENIAVYESYLVAAEARKRKVEREVNTLKANIRDRIGNDAGFETDNWKVTWTQNSNGVRYLRRKHM